MCWSVTAADALHADNDIVVGRALHTGTGCVTSWYVDLADVTSGAVNYDEFRLH